MTVKSDLLREAMRAWTTGVTVVTAAHENVQHGMTVSSFTSLSLDPPLVLISLQSDSRTSDLVRASERFGVTFLSADQQEVSERFAGRIGDHEDRIGAQEVEYLDNELPFLKGGLVYLDCRVVNTFDAGTNRIYIGEVQEVRVNGSDMPLLYFNRDYRRLAK